MRISDWSSDVCSSDLTAHRCLGHGTGHRGRASGARVRGVLPGELPAQVRRTSRPRPRTGDGTAPVRAAGDPDHPAYQAWTRLRSEEHTSELQSLMRSSYAVFCLNKKQTQNYIHNNHTLKCE